MNFKEYKPRELFVPPNNNIPKWKSEKQLKKWQDKEFRKHHGLSNKEEICANCRSVGSTQGYVWICNRAYCSEKCKLEGIRNTHPEVLRRDLLVKMEAEIKRKIEENEKKKWMDKWMKIREELLETEEYKDLRCLLSEPINNLHS